MNYKLIIGAAMLATTTTPALAQNAVSNGGFETGAFSPWTPTNVDGASGSNSAPVVIKYGSTDNYPTGAFGEPIQPNTVASLSPEAPGTYVAYFSTDSGIQTLTQTVTLAANTIYNIGFDYYAPQNGINNPSDAQLSFLIGGGAAGAPLIAGGSPISNTPAQTWRNFNTTFTTGALGGPTTLSFVFTGLGTPAGGTAADFAIDRVYAVAAVPEPASWALMIGGFGLAGYALRRRRAPAKLATA